MTTTCTSRRLPIRTADSSVAARGVDPAVPRTPNLKLTSAGTLSLPEIAGVLTPVAGYRGDPDVRREGRRTVRSAGARSRRPVGSRPRAWEDDRRLPVPGYRRARRGGPRALQPGADREDPKQPTDVTGHAIFDVTLASEPDRLPAADRIRATYAFNGPKAAGFGYQAAAVKVKGTVQGGRIAFDGRADAYRASATAVGSVTLPAERRPLAFDITGSASHVNLRALPPSARAPKLESSLDVCPISRPGRRPHDQRFRDRPPVRNRGCDGRGGNIGNVLHRSTHYDVRGRGSVSNLDLQRVGPCVPDRRA